MRAFFIFTITFFVQLNGVAQKKQAAFWRYSINNGFNFNIYPASIYRTKSEFISGAASVCDSNGTLQFSFNGSLFYDNKDSVIANLVPLEFSGIPYGGYDAMLIVPFQSNSFQYHVFSMRDGPFPPNLFRMVFDMRRNKGLGGWDTSKRKVIDINVAYQLTCLLHANGKDTWLVSRRSNSDTLIAWQIQDSGVVKTIKSKIHSPVPDPNVDNIPLNNSFDCSLNLQQIVNF